MIVNDGSNIRIRTKPHIGDLYTYSNDLIYLIISVDTLTVRTLCSYEFGYSFVDVEINVFDTCATLYTLSRL